MVRNVPLALGARRRDLAPGARSVAARPPVGSTGTSLRGDAVRAAVEAELRGIVRHAVRTRSVARRGRTPGTSTLRRGHAETRAFGVRTREILHEADGAVLRGKRRRATRRSRLRLGVDGGVERCGRDGDRGIDESGDSPVHERTLRVRGRLRVVPGRVVERRGVRVHVHPGVASRSRGAADERRCHDENECSPHEYARCMGRSSLWRGGASVRRRNCARCSVRRKFRSSRGRHAFRQGRDLIGSSARDRTQLNG